MSLKNTTNKVKRKKAIINRYGFIVLLFLSVFIVISVYIVRIMFVEGSDWRALGKKETYRKDREITPNRGNIYADDGRLLAASEPLYGIYMDFMADGIEQDTLMKYMDDLSKALSVKFPGSTAEEYKKIISENWAQSRKELAQIQKNKKEGSNERVKITTRYVRLIKRDINYIELKELRTLPFLNQRSNKSGLIAEERTMREKPYGRLAGRTIGSIYKDMTKGGASGLELKYDSMLRGKPGVRSRQKVQGRWIDVVQVPAEDGIDIKTTLDVDIQDIVENALRAKLIELEAESGTAIIMEVKTGEIKGISNLDRVRPGVYAEGNPNAFSYMSEPGSTFKTLSLMVALEDGVITTDEKFHVGTGLFKYGTRTIRDHYWRQGRDRGSLTVKQGFEISSNIVISKAILKGYEKNPSRYVDLIYKTGITKKIDWDVPLQGREGTTLIRHPQKDKASWSNTSLPWMSFGYETQVPPIYMLMFYNGIANGGKMIKPFLTKAFMKDGKTEEEFETEVINSSLCSNKTLKQIQDLLVGVVNEGTGKAVASESFQVAGKTGTAQIATGGHYSGYYVSFCGYFPADEPLYTCFVGIRRPKGSPSGGTMPGAVFKQVAEEVYSRKVLPSVEKIKPDPSISIMPYIKDGMFDQTKLVLSELKFKYNEPANKSEWVSASTSNNQINLKGKQIVENLVPDVVDMGLKDALYILEKSGLKVTATGAGKVRKQSIQPGTRVVRNSRIVIELD